MAFRYLRADESGPGQTRPDRTFGLAMWLRDGRTFFFPGCSPKVAAVLALLALGRELIEDDETRIEYGNLSTGTWMTMKVIKERESEQGKEIEIASVPRVVNVSEESTGVEDWE